MSTNTILLKRPNSNSGQAEVRPLTKQAKTKQNKTLLAPGNKCTEKIQAPDVVTRLIRLNIDQKSGGVDTFKELLVELGPLKKTWKAAKADGSHRRYFSSTAFPVPQDTDGTLLGVGVGIMGTSTAKIGSASRAGFSWVKGRSPSDIKLAKLSPAWQQRIGERMVAAVKASVAVDALPLGSARDGDVGRRVAEQVLRLFYASGEHLLALDRELMGYAKGVWRPLGREILEQRILEVLPSIPQVGQAKHATIKREVVDLLLTMQARDNDLFRRHSDPSRVINCHNGEVWLLDNGTVEFRPHSANSYLEHQLNIGYDPDATCPLYDNALHGIFAKSGASKAMIRHWHELAGYIIQPQRDHALVVVLFGEGNNGKTRLIQTVERLLGHDLYCAGRVEELESNRFSLASLRGKLVFVDDDVHEGIKLPDGTLKTISERKLLTGEIKYKDKFSFESRVVPVLLCNNVPSLTDVSRGMLRRLQVIPFDTTFTRKTADPNLFNKIWTSELPGVLNRAIEGWQRLHERNQFMRPKPVQQATRQWLTYANPLAGFLGDHCSKEPRANTRLEDIYAAFCQWLKQSGITRVHTKTKLKLQLKQLGYDMKKSNRGIKVLGLKLNFA